MSKSQESYSKKEKEKKRLKKAKEKRERREQRKLEKAEAGKKSFEDMLMYVDEFGNLTPTPPDPAKKIKVKLEDIQISVAKSEKVEYDPIRKGRVKFFKEDKGYGFIEDVETRESIFVHMNNLEEPVDEGDEVTFEVEQGLKGPNAVRVRITKGE